MIDGASFRTFLSGRVIGLALLVGFQIVVVRLLKTPAYADYALIVALAALLQTVTSFGIPRVIAKYLSGAGEVVSRRAARRLLIGLIACRCSACLLLLALSAVAIDLMRLGASNPSWPLWSAGAGYALATALQTDADGMAQALGLQTASRRAAVGEPLVRLAVVSGLALAAPLAAAALLWISAGSAAAAAVLLIAAAFNALKRGEDAPSVADKLDWRQVRRVAIGGYGGTLSWLIFSPAVVRLIASRILPTAAFAGFSFVQTLAVSAQRYAPSFTLFPLVEPAVMADSARGVRSDRIGAALSLLVKTDAVLVGAAIVGVVAFGQPMIKLLTHGRYGEAAVFLPWLLAGVTVNASHRSHEIAAIALDAPQALTSALGLTLLWMALALSTTPVFGVWPLLVCPFGDALTRFWMVQRALRRRGAEGVIALRGLAAVAAAIIGVSVVSGELLHRIEASQIERLVVGAAAVCLFGIIILALRSFDRSEIAMLAKTPLLGRLVSRSAAPSRKHRVMVLTPRGEGGTGGVDRLMDSLRPLLRNDDAVEVRFLTTRGARSRASLLTSLAAMVRLATEGALGRIDVIHVNLGAEGGCYRKMALMAVPRLLRVPYVLHLHGSGFDAFWRTAPTFARRRIDKLFLGAAQVIVLGEVWRQLVLSHVPAAAPRLVVLPNATARKDTAPNASAPAVVRILFLGELGVRKGSPTLIAALSRLRTHRPWAAVIAGDGDVMAARTQIERLGLCNRISTPGWVGAEKVDELLAASDILALPSREENLPMSVIEAFGAGLAVVATPVGALPDILRDGETGLIVPPDDVGALAAALSALIDDAPLRRRLGAAAKAYHAEHLSLGSYAKRVAAVWAAANRRADRL